MRISKELIKAAAFNPTKKSTQMSIFDMCQKIDNKSISLPLYQIIINLTYHFRDFFTNQLVKDVIFKDAFF